MQKCQTTAVQHLDAGMQGTHGLLVHLCDGSTATVSADLLEASSLLKDMTAQGYASATLPEAVAPRAFHRLNTSLAPEQTGNCGCAVSVVEACTFLKCPASIWIQHIWDALLAVCAVSSATQAAQCALAAQALGSTCADLIFGAYPVCLWPLSRSAKLALLQPGLEAFVPFVVEGHGIAVMTPGESALCQRCMSSSAAAAGLQQGAARMQPLSCGRPVDGVQMQQLCLVSLTAAQASAAVKHVPHLIGLNLCGLTQSAEAAALSAVATQRTSSNNGNAGVPVLLWWATNLHKRRRRLQSFDDCALPVSLRHMSPTSTT